MPNENENAGTRFIASAPTTSFAPAWAAPYQIRSAAVLGANESGRPSAEPVNLGREAELPASDVHGGSQQRGGGSVGDRELDVRGHRIGIAAKRQ